MVKRLNSCIPTLLFLLCFNLITAQQHLQDFYTISENQFNRGKYDEALTTNIKALQFAERNGTCADLAYANLKIGRMHYYLKDKRLALKNFFAAKTIIDSCGVDSLIYKVNHNIGAMYTELTLTDSALFYLNKALNSLNKTQRFADLAKTNSVIADLHMNNTHNLAEAEKFVTEAEKYAALSGNRHEIIFARIKRGALYRFKNDFARAIAIYKGALADYEAMGYTEGRLHMTKSIADMMALSGDKESIKYYWKLLVLKDSVFRAETAAKVAESETLYKTEKKDNENKLLQQENIVKQSKIDSRNKTIAGILIGVFALLAILLWRISVLNLRKKKQELEAARTLQKEKERISRDLHDNVGGKLSYVLYSLEDIMAEDKLKRAELKSNIDESVRSVISNLRETIWAINDENITINDLSDKLKVYAKNLFRNSNCEVVFKDNIPENSSLNPTTGLNLYRMCQEILNNIFKHAAATKIKIAIERVDEDYRITISDDGRGFDAATIKEGYGLNNIKNRATESGIKINFSSKEGEGTHYSLVVQMH